MYCVMLLAYSYSDYINPSSCQVLRLIVRWTVAEFKNNRPPTAGQMAGEERADDDYNVVHSLETCVVHYIRVEYLTVLSEDIIGSRVHYYWLFTPKRPGLCGQGRIDGP